MSRLFLACAVTVLGAGLTGCADSKSPAAPSPSATTALTADVALDAKPAHAAAARPGDRTIVENVLADDGEFDVLQAAVVRAGLAGTLNGEGQYTVFAPTDAAFVATLGAANEAAAVAAVEGLPLADLTNILLYHVTEGRRTSRSVLAAPRYEMLNGGILTRDALAAAGIAQTDISASKGVIHVINRVLLP
ncbi:MAG: fasciclin domain-containing protein [Vicinamibacterales bacterium]